MSCTSKQVKIAEEFTWSQSKSNLLFRLRSGRITASKFYDACKTKPTSPSISLVKEICYGTKKFHSKATDWGCKHEKTALQQYAKINIILIFSYDRRYRFDRPGLRPIARIEHGRSNRARNKGRSTDNVRTDCGFDRSNFRLAGHVDRSKFNRIENESCCSVVSVVIYRVAVYCGTLI